jgi:heat shock protein HtpX
VLGVGLILTAIYMAPRPARFPRTVASKATFPALHEAAGTVARGVGAEPPQAIVLSFHFNARYQRAGWRRRQLLTLGLPLLAILDDREFVALVGHEMAHGVNGDQIRGFFVGSAINSLGRWYHVLSPRRSRHQMEVGVTGLVTLIMSPIQRAFAQIPRATAMLLLHLLWRESQRAEYLADDLAARVAGTEATISLLAKLQLETLVDVAIQNVAMGASRETVLALVSTRCAALPARERKRLDAVSRLESSRLDSTHPPTGFRVALLEARPIVVPSVHLAATTWRAVEQEIAGTDPRITQLLVERYRDRLYRH